MTPLRSLLTACAALLITYTAGASDKPPFPRLAGANVGGPHNYQDPAYQARLAKLNFSVVNIWPGWEKTRATTFEEVVRNIKEINPNSKIFLYHISMEVADGNMSLASYRNKVDDMKWWASSSAPSVTRILSSFGSREEKPIHVINTTLHTPRDSDGHQFWEWDARWTVQQFYEPNPSLDGFFEDNVFWKPRIDADWNRDGKVEADTNPVAAKWLREGYRARFDLLRKLMPGRYQIGNIADWGHKDAVLTELNGVLDGGIIEGILGTHYAPESWGSWSEMMRWYRKTMAAIGGPKLVAFNQHGNPTDYQALRYGLASCLLDDAYFSFTDKDEGYSGLVWFDEYDADLGQAVSPPSTSPWQKGVYRRDFAGGIALVNPKGNGQVEVTLERDFQRIDGEQAPSINNGQLTRKVQLKDRDGIILLRLDKRSPPKPPQLQALN